LVRSYVTSPTTIKAITEIPANTPNPIGKTWIFCPGTAKAWEEAACSAAAVTPLPAAVVTSDAAIDDAELTDTAPPPLLLPLLLESEDAEAEAEAPAPAESVAVAVDDAGTDDKPLTLTPPPPAAAVEVDESVDDDPDVSVEDDPDVSVEDDESVEELELPEPLLEPSVEPEPELFTLLPIVTVQVLTS